MPALIVNMELSARFNFTDIGCTNPLTGKNRHPLVKHTTTFLGKGRGTSVHIHRVEWLQGRKSEKVHAENDGKILSQLLRMIGVGLCFNESWFKIYNYFFVANSTIKKKKTGRF